MPERELATMELARLLPRGAPEASALRLGINQPGIRAMALAEASLDEPDEARARELIEDAMFDILEVSEHERIPAAAGTLYAALRRLGDPRADAREAEIRSGYCGPAIYRFVDLSRLSGVAAGVLLRAGAPALAIDVCRPQYVRPEDRREVLTVVLSTGTPELATALRESTEDHSGRWELPTYGAELLAGLGRHREAMSWLDGFAGLSRAAARRGVVQHALAHGAPEAAALWEVELAAVPAYEQQERALWLLVRARADPEGARAQVETALAAACTQQLGKSGGLRLLVRDLGEAGTRCGADVAALRAMGGAMAAFGVLRATPIDAPEWPALYEEVRPGLLAERKAGRIAFDVLADLIELLARSSRIEESRALGSSVPHPKGLEEAEAGATVAAQARGGDLEGAYRTWSGIKKSARVYFVTPLLLACVEGRRLSELTALLGELPGDWEHRMPTAARALLATAPD